MAEELRIARDEAQRRSRVDALTEVYNRAHFVEELTRELDRAAREGETPAVVMLDLDYFKRVNDTFLHAGGDIVLREVARRIAGAVRGYDTVARWGGEEFVVLLPTVRDDEALRHVAEKLRLRDLGAADPVRRRRAGRDGLRRRRPGGDRPLHAPRRWSTPPTARSTPPSAAAATGCGCTAS